jgi:peptidoglycan/LPS O-acetylase OafA/YrhL
LLASGALALIPLGCTDNSSALMSIAGYSWLATFYALVLLLGISRPSSLLAGALRAGWLRATGEIAYGTYLLHEAVIGLCFAVVFASPPRVANRGEALTMLLAAVATIALARLSWSKFESKMVRIGQRRGYERDRVEVRDGRPVLREDRVG